MKRLYHWFIRHDWKLYNFLLTLHPLVTQQDHYDPREWRQ